MKELLDLFPELVFSNYEESIPHAEHDVVNAFVFTMELTEYFHVILFWHFICCL